MIKRVKRLPAWLLGAASCCAIVGFGYLLREFNLVFNPVLWTSLQVLCAFLSFTIAANVLPRFVATGDRPSLMLASAFVLGGLIQLAGIVEFYYRFTAVAQPLHMSLAWLSWMTWQMLLGLLLIAAFPIEKRLPWPRQPKKNVFAVLNVVAAAACLVVLVVLALPHEPAIYANSILPRPWNLLPAAIFIGATVVLVRKTHTERFAFDSSLVWLAGMNAACHLVAVESSRALDFPGMAAQFLKMGSYAVLLGATLLDNVRLFERVQDRATTDSMTGLANYRRFVDVLQYELERSGRTNRAFSVLLMDLDGLKEINDQYGHLTGSRAICRVAEVLRLHCRLVDTAARYGGDEFVLLLPETEESAARMVVARIRQCLEAETELPMLSISAGVATHPHSGTTVHHLLGAADRELYEVKAQSKRPKIRTPGDSSAHE